MVLSIAMLTSMGSTVMADSANYILPVEQEETNEARQACYSCGTGTLSYHVVRTEYKWELGLKYERAIYKYVCYSCGFQTPESTGSWVFV